MKSLISVSLILRYEKGSLTYSYLIPSASDEALYELGGAINSLQAVPVKSASKVLNYRITGS